MDSAQALPAAAPAMRVAPVVQPAVLPFPVKGSTYCNLSMGYIGIYGVYGLGD